MLFAVCPVRNNLQAVKRCLVFGVVLFLFCLGLAFPSWAQKEDWLPNISIKFPTGYTMEGSPQNQDASLPYARYKNVEQYDHNQLTTQRALLVNGLLFDTNKYSEVKEFFNKIQVGDEQQAVLHVGGANSASKGN